MLQDVPNQSTSNPSWLFLVGDEVALLGKPPNLHHHNDVTSSRLAPTRGCWGSDPQAFKTSSSQGRCVPSPSANKSPILPQLDFEAVGALVRKHLRLHLPRTTTASSKRPTGTRVHSDGKGLDFEGVGALVPNHLSLHRYRDGQGSHLAPIGHRYCHSLTSSVLGSFSLTH